MALCVPRRRVGSQKQVEFCERIFKCLSEFCSILVSRRGFLSSPRRPLIGPDTTNICHFPGSLFIREGIVPQHEIRISSFAYERPMTYAWRLRE